jgi:signal transduction histidine kinase/DNA-binding response OmpR family regulator
MEKTRSIENRRVGIAKVIKVSCFLLILCLGLFSRLTIPGYCQSGGFKYYKNYSPKEYDHLAQNWGIVQAKNGLIYAANHGGVLEFDSISWRIIGIPKYAPVRSLAIDETGTIYIGGTNKIGYLAPDANGTLKYISLLDYLEDTDRNFSNIWSTHATREGICFRAREFLFQWNSKEIKVWKTPNSFRTSFVCNDEFFVHEEKKGLLKMVNGSLQLQVGTAPFAEDRIYFLAPYNKKNTGELIMWVHTKGFFLYDGNTAKPFSTEADDYLKKNILFNGIRLTSGDFALATLRGGLVIIDPSGHQKYIFDNSADLQDNCIYHIFEDNGENLWLSLNSGITKVEYNSPFSIYDKRSNLPGLVYSVIKHQDDLYAGTSSGLFYLASPSQFRMLPGMSSPCWNLFSIGDSLLAATTEGVFKVSKNDKQKIIHLPSYVLLPCKHRAGIIWCGTSKGLAALSFKNGRWTLKHQFEIEKQEIRSIVEDEKENLWLGTVSGGVFKVDFPGDIKKPVVTRYNTSHGLPEGEVNAYRAAGHIVFTSLKGLFRFNKKNNSFVPDRTLGDEFAGGSNPVFRIVEDKSKHIWFHSESRNYHAVPQPDGSFKISSKPFRRIPTTAQVNAIFPGPNGKVTWFASHEGLIRYDTTVEKNDSQDFQTLVRRVLLNENQKNERQIFGGCENQITKDISTTYPIIEYKDRNLHFEFAAPFFEAENETKYQFFLEGYDKDWSAWQKESKRNYTNLDYGLYKFRVRARNVFQKTGKEGGFQFKILPPWYKTWWAFLLYSIVFLLLTYLLVRLRSHKLELDKQKLELTIEDRTKEIQEMNVQLKDQSEKLKEMDIVKSRFFANISHEFRTPLTLIMSPLEQMISKSRNKQKKQKLSVMLRNSQRLLTLINQLLELSRFDSKKTQLQANCQNIVSYLKDIAASFDGLARQNQLKLEFHYSQEDIPLYFDPPRLEEVMYNLLMNAIKYTPPGGKITVSVSKQERESAKKGEKFQNYVKISVKDTGIGISQEQMKRIFDRFYQAGNRKTKSQIGTGIGLSLTKEIILLHHGTIDVHSQEGKGTEFVIRLPLGNQHLKHEEMIISSRPAKPQKRKELENLYMAAEAEAEAEEIIPEKIEIQEDETEMQEKPLILVVEDDADVRKFICDPLKPDYRLVEAADGKEGIEKAKEFIPDLIVSDIMMPGVDGYELCRQLKQDIETSHIPIMLLTAKASEESILQGLKTGANDYITKPFNAEILLSRIKNLIDLRIQMQLKLQRQDMKVPDEIPVSSLDVKFLREFREIIEKNLSNPEFRIDDIYEKLKMARSTFFRKIKALTGNNPNQFILDYRLERGAQLLRENYGNVTEVAMAVGFNSSAYFSKCFNAKFHMSPTSYQASESKSS